ncbi:D-hexose-6-phosphate mutarotase [Lysobacter oculi]|uniref:Putative glucose-6-phosphate 1-epimerase n=1 Tax=Solilutibacter oculi TaxID=2698682 RepID=A0A344J6P1_9GAMM|nr:D-hexose-6-phosphate mutarotase [Lysobacter oculi]AXA84701.1 D-hexose-6-phosphate mutarotase [Lysobacter oculi]
MGVIELVSPDGCSRAAVSAFGARVLSWHCRGRERIFVPEALAADERAAPHGGIPVLHPQFGFFGPGRKHGLVRDNVWMHDGGDAHSASFRIVLGRAASDEPAHDVSLRVVLSDVALEVQLAVVNREDAASEFTCGLHTYLRVDDIAQATLAGLESTAYIDALAGLAETPAEATPLHSPTNVDRVYVKAPARLHIDDGHERLAIAQSGFGDTVVWNPGAEIARCFNDLNGEEWRRFLCVEAAQIKPPVVLAPGATWRGSQRLEVCGDDSLPVEQREDLLSRHFRRVRHPHVE